MSGSYNNIYALSDFSNIAGGNTNTIGSNILPGAGATFSFIGGGSNNCIDDNLLATSYGTIGGGQTNCILPGTNHGSIFGGTGNIVSGSCSVVLGGNNNSDGGYPNTAVYGNGLTATMSPAVMGVNSAMWLDELILPNLPVDTSATGTGAYASLPNGALYTTVPLGTGFMASVVYIK